MEESYRLIATKRQFGWSVADKRSEFGKAAAASESPADGFLHHSEDKRAALTHSFFFKQQTSTYFPEKRHYVWKEV